MLSFTCSVVSDPLRPLEYGPPGSSVHGILQAKILESVAISFSRGIFVTRTLNSCVSCTGRQILYHWEAQVRKNRTLNVNLIS